MRGALSWLWWGLRLYVLLMGGLVIYSFFR